MIKEPAYSIGESFLTVTFLEDGQNFVINKNNEANRFTKCIQLIHAENWSDLRDYLTPKEFIETESNGDITIHGEVLKYKGMLVDNVVCDRIISCIQKDLPYKNLAAFLKNTLEGMDKVVLRELFLFLETAKSMPILNDGCFLAFRHVRSDYMSGHANPDGTRNRNKVGDINTMDRELCDPNRNNECSKGLHFCSYEYLPHYYGGGKRIMIVKINPKDVISIPRDYNNQKGRCCKYEVVGEVDTGGATLPIPTKEECTEKANEVSTKLDNGESVKPESVEFTEAEAKTVIEILNRRTQDEKSVEVRKVSKVTKPYINVDKFLAVVDTTPEFTYETTTPKSKTIITRC